MDGWKIRRMRKMLDLSQQDLAWLFDLSPCTLARYEAGSAKPGDGLTELFRDLASASEDPGRARAVHDLVREKSPRPGILWFVLDPVYRHRPRD